MVVLGLAQKVWQGNVTCGCTKPYAYVCQLRKDLLIYYYFIIIITISTDAGDAVIHSCHCWWRLRLPSKQCAIALCALDHRAHSAWNSEIHSSGLVASY